jgi:formyltetrahydrofolate deformylase
MTREYVLTLSCRDRPGIVHAVSGFLLEQGGNILEAAQFGDRDTERFFMRVNFAVEGERASVNSLDEAFDATGRSFGMRWGFFDPARKTPTIIMVSKLGHCLNDLLFRHRSGLLPIDIRAIVSNHRDFYQLAASYDVTFHHLPITPERKPAAEARLLEIIGQEQADLVILARYMQVLSDGLCRELEGRAINIHHSFLPSFKGAQPYRQAHDRGVKLIGATAHYVTPALDEGPIIEQDVARVDHSMDAATLTAIGRDVENVVLARAVKWHAEHRILLNGTKTVVFR